MKKEQTEIIKKIVTEMLEKAGFLVKVDINESNSQSSESVVCNIEIGENSHLLIGQYGVNLQALQHVARLLVRKKVSEKVKFVLDINNYRQQKNNLIAKMAHEAAEQAVRERKAVVMRPMSAYERRLVHLELAGEKNVETESVGNEEERKVVIRPSKELQ